MTWQGGGWIHVIFESLFGRAEDPMFLGLYTTNKTFVNAQKECHSSLPVEPNC